MSAFDDDEDKYGCPVLRRYVERYTQSRDGVRAPLASYDEAVEMMSNYQRADHAKQIVRQLQAMLMMQECTIIDPEPGKPPVIHMTYGGRSYVMMLDNAM